jgi:hypothetical protein
LFGQCTKVLVDKMKQDTDWVRISESFDPTLLFKSIEKFVLKQSDDQYATAVLIAEQLSILSFRQDRRSCYELQSNLIMIKNCVAFDHKIPNKN